MPNIATVLKMEILRLARKEIRIETASLRKASTSHRRQIAALKREIAELEQRSKTIARRTSVGVDSAKEDMDVKRRFSAKGFKSLRAKLGLAASDLGTLLGVSMQSVYNWERGTTTPRAAQLKAIAGFRSMGKREAMQRLRAVKSGARRPKA